mmetsp:Transcript_13027/g.30752  ORF Transcript_13027/g.30752 Transcript_13027/m.30752 type:complete len:313 (+) Transcript_13027:453-1391(+)
MGRRGRHGHELLGVLAEADGLHDRLAGHDGEVRAAEAVGGLGRPVEVPLAHRVRRVSEVEPGHTRPGGRVGQRDVDPLLEAAADGGVELPRHVGGPEDEEAVHLVRDALHLDQKLGLDPPGGLGLALGPRAAHGVHLVDEDDGVLLRPRHLEERLDQLLRLALPLAHQVRRRDGEERGVRLGRYRLGQVRLARPRRPIEEDPPPRSPLPDEELRETSGQDDRLLEGLLGPLQTGHVAPLHVGLVGDDGGLQLGLEARSLFVDVVGRLVPALGSGRCRRRPASSPALLGIAPFGFVQHLLQLLRTVHVTRRTL